MPRGSQVARWYTFAVELAQSRRGWSAEALAKRHGYPPRTVYRDLEQMEAEAGFPLIKDGARWRLDPAWERRLPFPLPLGEIVALKLARQLIGPLAVTPVGRAFGRLADRLAGPDAPLARPAQGELFVQIREQLSTPSLVAIDYAPHAATIETLCAAHDQRRTVRAEYWVETRQELTRRNLDVYALHYDPVLEALYAFAWCHLRRAVRTFAVHRFRRAVRTDRRFETRAGFTAAGHLAGAFRIWRGEHAVRVRLAIDAADAGWVGERRWHASQQQRRLAGGGLELTFTVDSTRELRRFVLQFGAACEVLEPESLREAVAREHAAAAKRAAGPAQENLSFDGRPGEQGSARP